MILYIRIGSYCILGVTNARNSEVFDVSTLKIRASRSSS